MEAGSQEATMLSMSTFRYVADRQTDSSGGQRRALVALNWHGRDQFAAGKPVEKPPTCCARSTDCRATASDRVSLSVDAIVLSWLADIGVPRKTTDDECRRYKVTFCELNISLVLWMCLTTSHFKRFAFSSRCSAVFSHKMNFLTMISAVFVSYSYVVQ